MSQLGIDRRRFLAASAAAGVFSIVPRHVLGGPGQTPPSEKLNIAGIGIGGKGSSDLRHCEGENIVALCDVDFDYAEKTLGRYPDAERFRDYRVMLESRNDLDAVVIATPDHTHAAIAMAAIQAGLHVHCQKPLTHDIAEARALTEAARAAGVATQMGIQGHSTEAHRLICEWIWDGAIGTVREIDAWCSLSYYPPGHAGWSSAWSDRPEDTPAAPEGLDWDVWLGPAPTRPYHPAYHPKVWRCWWDFGCGMMGDRGAHTFDPIYNSLKLTHPTSVEASIMGGNKETHPLAAIVTYQFPKRKGLPPVKLTWYEGIEPPRPDDLEEGRRLPREGGVLFKGDKGTIMCGVYGNGARLIPETAMKAYKQPAKTLPRVIGNHMDDWIRACKTGESAGANFDYSGPLTEIALLGNVAKRFPGRTIDWNGADMLVTNLKEANEWVRRPRRDGWAL